MVRYTNSVDNHRCTRLWCDTGGRWKLEARTVKLPARAVLAPTSDLHYPALYPVSIMLSSSLRRTQTLLTTTRLSTRVPPSAAFTIRFMSSTSPRSYEYILTSRPDPSVALITLNRPKALNALSSPLFAELNAALAEVDADDAVGAVVLTGSEKAFAGVCGRMVYHQTRVNHRGL